MSTNGRRMLKNTMGPNIFTIGPVLRGGGAGEEEFSVILLGKYLIYLDLDTVEYGSLKQVYFLKEFFDKKLS